MSDYYDDGRLLREKNLLARETFDVAAWALDLVDLDPVARALDAGCGWGRFAGPLRERAAHVQLTCADLRAGMAATCRASVPDAPVLAADITRLASSPCR